MFRIILFLVLIALAARVRHGWPISPATSCCRGAAGASSHVAGLRAVARHCHCCGDAGLDAVAALWRMPDRIRRGRRERRQARGRHAITQGLLAIGHGDSTAARAHADVARRHAAHDPLALLLHAQSAQLDGDRAGAQRAFRAMAEREDTQAARPARAVHRGAARRRSGRRGEIAEEALKLAPASTWASQAVLGFRCAKGDWNGALTILDNNLESGLIDKPA